MFLCSRLDSVVTPGRFGAPNPGAETREVVLEPPGVDADRGRGPLPTPLMGEFRYGNFSFCFPVEIEREQLQAVYRNGLLTLTAPKTNMVSSVTVNVES